MKSNQLSLIEKCICLTILSVSSVYKFSEMYLSYSLNFTTNNLAIDNKIPIFLINGLLCTTNFYLRISENVK